MRYGYIKIYAGESRDLINEQEKHLRQSGIDIIVTCEIDGPESISRHINGIPDIAKNDTLVFCSVDRMGLFLSGIFETLEILSTNNIDWELLKENINSADYVPGFWNKIFKNLMESEGICRKTSTAYGRGSAFPAKPKAISDKVLKEIKQRIENKETIVDIAKSLNIHRLTIHKYLKSDK